MALSRARGLAIAGVTALIRLSVAVGAEDAQTAPAADGDAEAVLNSLYGQQIRAVKATSSLKDDAELAWEILASAQRCTGQPALLALLCEKAYELGATYGSGYTPAIEAMNLLAEKVPQKEKLCWKRILPLLRRKYSGAKRFRRMEAGEYYVLTAVRRAMKLGEAGECDDALALLREARSVASAVRSREQTTISAMQKHFLGRSRIARRIKLLEARLKSRPADRNARTTLVQLYVREVDQPAKAARLLDAAEMDEAWRTYVPLAAKPIDEIDPNVWVELGDWYRSLASGASAQSKTLVLRRAAKYYGAYLDAHDRADLNRTKVTLALQSVERTLKADRRDPARKAISGLRPDLLAYARARDKLPWNLRVQVIQAKLKETNDQAKISIMWRPDPQGKTAGATIYDQPGLVRLDAIAGMALTGLTVSSCPNFKGDLSALVGMELTSLCLDGCSRLESLHGIEGMPIRQLLLNGCTGLKGIRPAAGMPLEKLTLRGCRSLASLDGLQDSPLTSLVLFTLPKLQDLTGLKGSKIASLELVACHVLQSLHGIEHLPLTQLRVRDCTSLRTLAAMKGLTTGMKELDLIGYAALESLDGLQGQPFTKLRLRGCRKLTGDLTALKDCAKLTDLNLRDCSGLTSLKGLEKLPLTRLELCGCRKLTGDLSVLKDCVTLTSLSLRDCDGLTSLKGLEELPLTFLHAGGCRNLTGDLSALAKTKLTYLNLSGCEKLTSLRGIEKLPLQHLDIGGCYKVPEQEYQRIIRIKTLVFLSMTDSVRARHLLKIIHPGGVPKRKQK